MITPNFVPSDFVGYNAASRNAENFARYLSTPGIEGFAYRNGGLEKDYNKGGISTDAMNHQKMVDTRAAKVKYVENVIPELEIYGNEAAELLVVGWGSTRGHLMAAVSEMLAESKSVALAHFNYINPLPKNTGEVLRKYKKVVVCELNSGQFVSYLRNQIPEVSYLQYNKVQGQPFKVTELEEHFSKLLND